MTASSSASAIALIPARGGSKRIPRKNVRPLCGKPLIAWSIEAARASGCFESVIVSTEDAEIAAIARDHGAETPFVRPEALANDHCISLDVIEHAVAWIRDTRGLPDYVCCIYATALFVTPDDLRRGAEAIRRADADYAFSITSFPFPIQRALRLTPEGGVAMFQPEHIHTRSQDLEPAYHDAGQFYWGRATAWLARKEVFGPTSVPVILPRHRVQDIDTEEDWDTAERLFALHRARDAKDSAKTADGGACSPQP